MTHALLHRAGLPPLAYHALPGAGPALVFLGGFRSDMTGTKATFLEAQCAAAGRAFVRFDYRGHGASDGDFNALTLSDWLDDALLVLDLLTAGPVILAGSSMGGWLGLLAALARPARVRGFVGIAAAPDFTRWMRAGLSPAQAEQMVAQGHIDVPSGYSAEPYRISQALLDDGERHCLLDGPIRLACPVRLLQGQMDAEVPWQIALRIQNAIGAPAQVTLIPDGDHRLSRPEDLALLWQAVIDLS